MTDFQLNFPDPEGKQVKLSIRFGEILFLLGANGTGKSSLMHKFATQNTDKFKRISANRQIWLHHNDSGLTPSQREQTETNIMRQDQVISSIYSEVHGVQRAQVAIFDLVEAENREARECLKATKNDDDVKIKEIKERKSPITLLNDILKISNIDIEIKIGDQNKILAARDKHDDYSIVELSDGERNAILLIASVLTAPKNTLMLLDEPERHLHRSIISPLITTLLSQRSDCAFVVSTHDIFLPRDQSKADVLVLRSYIHNPQAWKTNLIDNVQNIDEDITKNILGSREKIIFIEGKNNSLDIKLYELLFPNYSIKSVGSCTNVEKSVRGIRNSNTFNWIQAYGIIDRDNRSYQEVQNLIKDWIAVLDQYSVESLYYHPSTIRGVLERVSLIQTIDIEEVMKAISEKILNEFKEHKNRMSERLAEKRILDELLYRAQTCKKTAEENINISLSTNKIFQNEKEKIETLLFDKDISTLISKYPIRETGILNIVSKAMNYTSKDAYQNLVLKMLTDSEEKKESMRQLMKPIIELLNT